MGLIKDILLALFGIDNSSNRNKNSRGYYSSKPRRSYHVSFDKEISFNEFKNMVYFCSNPIQRLNVKISGPIIYGKVLSQSGNNVWKFELDFNDYGNITGKYWITSDNPDSEIPNNLGYKISQIIKEKINRG